MSLFVILHLLMRFGLYYRKEGKTRKEQGKTKMREQKISKKTVMTRDGAGPP